MLDVCPGNAIDRLLAHVLAAPERFVQVVFCAPYIDALGFERIRRVLASRNPRSVRVITRPERAVELASLASKHAAINLHLVPSLHAKVYAAIGRDERHHQALVTSANLTGAALTRNVELGISITGTNPQHARLVEHLFSRLKAT